MSDDVLVKVDNVSKRFCRSLKRSLWYGLQDLGSEIGGRRHGGGRGLPQSSHDVQLRPDEFWAVKDVSFELRRGECLGLIGRNGAGKTTLLRMLNGLIKPDTGNAELKGRIGALIALGAGFNPVLTGKENIYVNGSVLGLTSRQIEEKVEEIVEFAEIERFINSPVQSYSSGMQVRLGFAVATAMKPDILLIDEVLAVGDLPFRAKSYGKLGEIMRDTAVIIVSHNEAQIQRLCKNSAYLTGGRIKFYGETPRAFQEYNAASSSLMSSWPGFGDVIKHELVKDFKFVSDCANTSTGGHYSAEILLEVGHQVEVSSISLHFSKAGEFVCQAVHSFGSSSKRLKPGINKFAIDIEYLPLSSGRYTATLIAHFNSDRDILVQAFDVCNLSVTGSPPSSSSVSIPLNIQAVGL